MISQMNYQEEFVKRLCPHRGIGEDNTLGGIERGLELKPFLLEFDIQHYDHELHLGHPPEVNETATLADALSLYSRSKTIPKVDLKLTDADIEVSLNLLAAELAKWSPRKVLVNIAGELRDAASYMEAESTLLKITDNNVLLNIDLDRYRGISDNGVAEHVENLERIPFSISPNLDANIPAAIDFALQHDIPNIHFWSSFDKRYSKEHLFGVMGYVLDSALEVYFDIKAVNIG